MPLPKISNRVEQNEQTTEAESDQPESSRAGARNSAAGPLISLAMRAKALAALEAGLEATRRIFDRDKGDWIVEPDFATRTKCVELTLAYDVGKPVERQVKLTGNFESYSDKLEKLLASPEGITQALALGLIAEDQAKERRQKLSKRVRIAE